MVYDFSKTCKTYDANVYKKEDFAATRCPGCNAVGRFNLHGSYNRYAMYFLGIELACEHLEIKRIRCMSCKSTHAVMPWDIIPYKLLTLIAVLLILRLFYLRKKPAGKMAEKWEFSHQFIYSAIAAFRRHAPRIHLYFKETSRGAIVRSFNESDVVALIKKPYEAFHAGYQASYKRPCFMCKFFDKPGAPPIGRLAALPPPRRRAT